MGFADSKSKSSVRGDISAQLDQAVADEARVIDLQNIEFGKKGSVTLDIAEEGSIDESFSVGNIKQSNVKIVLTPEAAIAAGADALSRSADIALLGVNHAAGVVVSSLESNAGLLGDLGDALGAGFSNALDFASAASAESNALAGAIIGGPGAEPIGLLRRSTFGLSQSQLFALVAMAGVGFWLFKKG